MEGPSGEEELKSMGMLLGEGKSAFCLSLRWDVFELSVCVAGVVK